MGSWEGGVVLLIGARARSGYLVDVGRFKSIKNALSQRVWFGIICFVDASGLKV